MTEFDKKWKASYNTAHVLGVVFASLVILGNAVLIYALWRLIF